MEKDIYYAEWIKNRSGLKFDYLAICSRKQVEKFIAQFSTQYAIAGGCPGNWFWSSKDEKVYLYGIDTHEKTITPLPTFSYAVGNQYNGYLPVGKKADNLIIDFSEYTLKIKKDIHYRADNIRNPIIAFQGYVNPEDSEYYPY
ncbi:MAG: hypothetical protein E7496_02315 [Ruminococcus sp.]|nr:hypothetical protein [Ruminococcus sp.]